MRTSIKTSKTLRLAAVAVLGACLPLSAVHAGTPDKTPAVVTPPPEVPFVTGNLTINYETAFVSNGLDVWGTGKNWNNWFIHPSLELDFQVAKDLQFYVNTWWDVNDQIPGTIGKYIQEVDVNVGFYYTLDKLKFQLGYGAWNYASQTESVIDFRATYNDGFWSPFLALHGRIDNELGLDNGLLVQLGIAPSKTWGALTVALPITVDADCTKNYASPGGDSGFGFVSAGLSLTYAVSKHVAINLGATYYHTEDKVFPTNPSSDFVTGLAGFTVSF
jgi:hypothetical protein